MKKAKLIAILAILTIVSACEKDGEGTSVIGKWELRHQGGGWGVDTSFAPGNGNTIEFNAASRFTQMRVDTTLTGQYSIKAETDSIGYRNGTLIYPNPLYPFTEPLRLKHDTLYIGTSIADGIVSQYVKLK
jgi:hypothetical protein